MKARRRGSRFSPLSWTGSSLMSSVLMFVSIVLMVTSSFRPKSFDGLRMLTSDFLEMPLAIISYPFQSVTLMLHDITDFAQLQADNLRLEQENIRLRKWYQTALLLDSENRALRELLNLRIDPSYTHIAARILADSGNTYVKSILITVGARDGVIKDAAVVAGEGLIGRVVEVGENTAHVLLVNDINSRVPVMIEDTGQHAIMAGTNQINPKLIHVPKDSEILEGARIITSGYGGVYPQGLPIGRVQLGNDGTMKVILFSDFDKLGIVRVLQKETGAQIQKNKVE